MNDNTNEENTKKSKENRNPFIKARADKPADEVTREDCWFGVDEEDALYDAYVMLRAAGYEQDELEPLLELIQRATIYDYDKPEWFFNEFVNPE